MRCVRKWPTPSCRAYSIKQIENWHFLLTESRLSSDTPMSQPHDQCYNQEQDVDLHTNTIRSVHRHTTHLYNGRRYAVCATRCTRFARRTQNIEFNQMNGKANEKTTSHLPFTFPHKIRLNNAECQFEKHLRWSAKYALNWCTSQFVLMSTFTHYTVVVAMLHAFCNKRDEGSALQWVGNIIAHQFLFDRWLIQVRAVVLVVNKWLGENERTTQNR